MKPMQISVFTGLELVALYLSIAASSGLQAQEADLSSNVVLPTSISMGQPFTV